MMLRISSHTLFSFEDSGLARPRVAKSGECSLYPELGIPNVTQRGGILYILNYNFLLEDSKKEKVEGIWI